MDKNGLKDTKQKSRNRLTLDKTVTSPISQENLVSKVNALTLGNSFFNNSPVSAPVEKNSTLSLRYIVDKILEMSTISDSSEYFSKIFSIITQAIDSKFVAVGVYKEKSSCINLRLQDCLNNNYTTKVFIKDSENPIVRAFLENKIQYTQNDDYLKLSYYKKYSTIVIPLVSINKCIGVLIVEDRNMKQNSKVYSLLANNVALTFHNISLQENAEGCSNTDSLTLLYNHRGFQEVLSSELATAKISKQPLSIIMMDINNITRINRELGHAKGDEVIKLVAEKVRQCVREGDTAGRYGGDEIAVIMPKTDSAQAKYIAEFITYTLSCCFIDGIGPIKVSVGVATYPDCAEDKEKLLILAEQAMYISLAKGYKDGMSAIISSSDFNFWDDVALRSYADVILKRHSQLSVNFEDELISRFHSDQEQSDARIWEVATSLAGAIDAKDPYTKGHSTSVSKYSEALARAINLPEKEVERITLGALLHDVGKIGIPESVLKKEGPLSDEEWLVMKQHPSIGVDKVLKPNASLKDLIPIVKHHHERIDGKGYPDKLKGDEIPLAAKIVAIADTYHALTSDRPYRKGMSLEKAVAILEDGAGTQWDADLVRTFVRIAPSLGL